MKVNLPDGTVINFPDSMSNEEISEVINRQFGEQFNKSENESPSFLDKAKAAFSPRNLVNQLPTAGMMVGGTLGAGGGLFTPIPGGAALGGLAGATLGGGIGESIKSNIEQYAGWKPQQGIGEEIGNIAKKGMLPAAEGWMLGESLPFMKGPVSPTAAFDDAIKASVRSLQSQGVPLSGSIINPNLKTRMADEVIDRIWPLNTIANKRRKEVFNSVQQMQDDFQRDIGIYGFSPQEVNVKWNNFFEQAGGKDAPINLPAFSEVLLDGATGTATKGKAFWKNNATGFLEKEITTVQDLRDIISVLNTGVGKGADATLRRKAMDALKTDLQAINPELVDLLTAARQTSVQKYQLDPIKRLFERSMEKDISVSDVEFLNPSNFVNNYNKMRNDLISRAEKNNLIGGMNTIDALDMLANRFAVMGPDVSKFVRYQKTPPSILSMGGPAGIGAALYYNPMLALPAGAAGALAWDIARPSGMVRKLMIEGAPPMLNELGRTGFKTVIQKLGGMGNIYKSAQGLISENDVENPNE